MSIDSSSVNYNAPGVYPVPFQLSRLKNDGVREYLGTNTLFVVVEG